VAFVVTVTAGTRDTSRIRVPNALRGPQEAAGRQGRRFVLVATRWLWAAQPGSDPSACSRV